MYREPSKWNRFLWTRPCPELVGSFAGGGGCGFWPKVGSTFAFVFGSGLFIAGLLG